MIVRAWRGYASAAAPDAYPKHLLERVRPNLERLSPERAVVEPAARAALTRFDEQVTHYDVLAGSGIQPSRSV